jgi:hypothetical protein
MTGLSAALNAGWRTLPLESIKKAAKAINRENRENLISKPFDV